MLGMAGAFAALSALTKLAGAACLIALLADLLWLHFDNRRLHFTLSRLLPQLLSMVGGALVAAVVVLGPFLVMSFSQITRMIIFFQILRPSDGLIDIPSRIADISSTFGNALTALCTSLGFILISIWVWRRSAPGTSGPPGATSGWRTLALWTFFSLLLFTYSRSFYSHYYIQLAAPLCLLGSGVTLLQGLLPSAEGRTVPAWAKWAFPVALALVALPFVAVEWEGAHSRAHENRSFELVGKYVNDAVRRERECSLPTASLTSSLPARPATTRQAISWTATGI